MKHILLVEDNLTNQKVTQIMLKRLQCEVTVAANGKQAVEKFMNQHYDLILMDCQMPEMDGFAATEAIRQQEHEAHIPIIALTGTAMSEDISRCKSVGMDDYLHKPIKLPELEQALKRWF